MKISIVCIVLAALLLVGSAFRLETELEKRGGGKKTGKGRPNTGRRPKSGSSPFADTIDAVNAASGAFGTATDIYNAIAGSGQKAARLQTETETEAGYDCYGECMAEEDYPEFCTDMCDLVSYYFDFE